MREHDGRRRRELRRRVAQQPRRARSGPVLPHERARHPGAARGAPGGSRSTASTTSRPARSTATSPLDDARGLHRGRRRTGPRTPYNASKAGGRPRRARLPRDVRAADHDHELLQQLRAVPVPGEGDPALRHERARRPAAAALRVDREPARVAPRRSTTAARSSSCSSDGRVGRDIQRRVGRRGERSSEIADRVLDAPGQARVAEDHRARPPRSRPPLSARLTEDPSRARLAATRSTSRTACETTVEWYAANRAWWEPLRERMQVEETAWR